MRRVKILSSKHFLVVGVEIHVPVYPGNTGRILAFTAGNVMWGSKKMFSIFSLHECPLSVCRHYNDHRVLLLLISLCMSPGAFSTIFFAGNETSCHFYSLVRRSCDGSILVPFI